MVHRIGMGRVYNATARAGLSRRRSNDGGMQLVKAATSLRPHIVQVMARRQGHPDHRRDLRAGGRPGSSWFQPQREAGSQLGQPGTQRSRGLYHPGPQ